MRRRSAAEKEHVMPTWEARARQEFGGRIRNLVFEGGGVWGIAYEGVLSELDRLGMLDGVTRVGGASAGAITACLLATGHSAADLGRLLRETRFSEFTDDSFGLARDTTRLLTKFGWYKGKAFRNWIRDRVKARTDEISTALGIDRLRPMATFRELRVWQRRAAARGVVLPELYLVGSNLSRQRREVYSAERRHSPEMAVVDAVRASMSIPLFFASVRNRADDVLVDGGLTWNYPVNLFDDKRYVEEREQGLPIAYAAHERHVFNAETLGFRLDTTAELQANLSDWNNEPYDIDNIVHYAWALLGFVRAVANKQHLHKNDWARTIFVDVGNEVRFNDFGLTAEQTDFLARRGRDGVRAWARWRVSRGGATELQRIYRTMAKGD